jgi:hypothetical protein
MRGNNNVIDVHVLGELGGQQSQDSAHKRITFVLKQRACALLPPLQLPQHSQLELCKVALVMLQYPPLLCWHCCQHHAGVFAVIALALLGWHFCHCIAGFLALVTLASAQSQCRLQHPCDTWRCHFAHCCCTRHC